MTLAAPPGAARCRHVPPASEPPLSISSRLRSPEEKFFARQPGGVSLSCAEPSGSTAVGADGSMRPSSPLRQVTAPSLPPPREPRTTSVSNSAPFPSTEGGGSCLAQHPYPPHSTPTVVANAPPRSLLCGALGFIACCCSSPGSSLGSADAQLSISPVGSLGMLNAPLRARFAARYAARSARSMRRFATHSAERLMARLMYSMLR